MPTLIQDVRYALRTLAGRPGFTLVVVATLALGIGSTTAVFDLVNLLAWIKPSVARPQEVVEVYTVSRHAFVGPYGLTPFPDYEDYRDSTETLTGLAAFLPETSVLESHEAAEKVEAWAVTGNFFEVLGLRAALGRMITAADDRPGRPPAAVLGHGLWRRLGADPDLIGRPVRLNGAPFTVVGIAPEGFRGTKSGSRVGVYFPSHFVPEVEDPETGWLRDRTAQRWHLLGRLAAGREPGEARAELAVVAARLDREHPIPDFERRITVAKATLGHPIDRKNLGPTLRLFGAAVFLLVLIVCANVAHLQLSRAAGRAREMGIRQSLGASRRRLARQLMTESLLLALAGGLGGLFLALKARAFMAVFFGEEMIGDLRFDHRVLGLTLLSSLFVTLLFGLAPALITSRVDLVSALKDAAAVGGRHRRLAAGPLLAVAQIALSLVLLVSAALLVQSLWRFRNSDLGFDTENLLVAEIDVSPARLSHEGGRQIYRQMAEGVARLPGVGAAGLGLLLPPVFLEVEVRFHLPSDPETKHASRFDFVDAGYLETLGLPLLQGRLFEPRDRVFPEEDRVLPEDRAASEEGVSPGGRASPQGDETALGTVVINQTLAEKLWPQGGAVGQRIRLERPKPKEPAVYEVIGVVGSVRQYRSSRAAEGVLYFTWEQRYRPFLNLVMRAEGDPAATFAAAREELRRRAPGLVLEDMRTHDDYRWYVLVEQRLQTQTLGLFSLAGFVLALLGIFGVMSASVSRQVREIGIRMALGARRRDVLRWVLGQGLALALWGVALGIVGTFWAVGLLRGMLAEAEGVDLRTLAAAALALFAAAAAAVFLPARRASGVDPQIALRSE